MDAHIHKAYLRCFAYIQGLFAFLMGTRPVEKPPPWVSSLRILSQYPRVKGPELVGAVDVLIDAEIDPTIADAVKKAILQVSLSLLSDEKDRSKQVDSRIWKVY